MGNVKLSGLITIAMYSNGTPRRTNLWFGTVLPHNGTTTAFSMDTITTCCGLPTLRKTDKAGILQVPRCCSDSIVFPSNLAIHGNVFWGTDRLRIAKVNLVTGTQETPAPVSLLLDLYKEAGCDSFAGRAASIMMSCTETVFYTMAVYFGAVHIKKTRYTLAGALLSSLVGMAVSIALAGLL